MRIDSSVGLDRPIESAALRRLAAEVASGVELKPHRGYNRTYNRHNR